MDEPGLSVGALKGLKVIDLTRVLAGPLCTQILADHGAEVIKVEPPEGDETRRLGPPFNSDGVSAYYLGLNRNKRAMALDLRRPDGREVLLRLLDDADVLVENFVPGTMERWGLGYEGDLAMRFPRLVYCAISGFGGDGPYGGLPGYDAVLQALCGLMSVNGCAHCGPTRIGVPVVDIATGLHAVIGILLALTERARSGRGQRIEATLFDTAYALMHPHAANYFVSEIEPALTGNAHPNISPYDIYSGADGSLFLGVVNDAQFRRFCEVLGRTDLAADARFGSNALRLANRAALREAVETAVAREPVESLCARLMSAGVPAAPVRPVSRALRDPHARHRGTFLARGAYRGIAAVQKLSRTPAELRSAPPTFAADTRAVLSRLGYSRSEIEALVRDGVAPLEPRGARKASPQKERS